MKIQTFTKVKFYKEVKNISQKLGLNFDGVVNLFLAKVVNRKKTSF